jgi:hypothetical protein
MEVSKVPPPAVSTSGAAGATGVAGATGAATTEQPPQSAATIAPPADRADIRPLDVPGALQILIAEVRAALDLTLATAAGRSPIDQGAAIPQSPAQAARELVQMLLQALPDDMSDAAAWTATLARVEAAFQSSVERAVDAVSLWRAVPPPVVDAAKETRALAVSVLDEETPNPLWLRPEWAGLAPRVQRFWRRRRNARRRLTDPDYSPGTLDESEEFQP